MNITKKTENQDTVQCVFRRGLKKNSCTRGGWAKGFSLGKGHNTNKWSMELVVQLPQWGTPGV